MCSGQGHTPSVSARRPGRRVQARKEGNGEDEKKAEKNRKDRKQARAARRGQDAWFQPAAPFAPAVVSPPE
eukprot:1012057-Lingulodinium_polyedra.AAC.1